MDTHKIAEIEISILFSIRVHLCSSVAKFFLLRGRVVHAVWIRCANPVAAATAAWGMGKSPLRCAAMGFSSGSLSFRRFAVLGESPEAVDQEMLDTLATHALRERDLGVPEEEEYGFSGGRHV